MNACTGNRLFPCAAILLLAGALLLTNPATTNALPSLPLLEEQGDPDHPSSSTVTEQRNNNAPGQPREQQDPKKSPAGRRAVVAHGTPSTPALPTWFVVRTALSSLVRTVSPSIRP
jgi:hypothetical protein